MEASLSAPKGVPMELSKAFWEQVGTMHPVELHGALWIPLQLYGALWNLNMKPGGNTWSLASS